MRYELLLLVALSGCGSAANDNNNHGYGYEYDLSAIDGLRLRNHAPITVLDQSQMEGAIDQPYHEVETCMQIMTGGPLVVVVGNDAIPTHGIIYFDHGLIVMTDGSVQDGLTLTPAGEPLSMMKHEFVHYLLLASGFPDELNATHQSPLFVKCAGL